MDIQPRSEKDRNANPVAVKKAKKISPVRRKTLNILAITIWMIAFVTSLGFDFIIYVFDTQLSSIKWLVYWPLPRLAAILLISFIAYLTVFNRQKRWFFFIIFYPIVLVFWYLPKHVILKRHWMLGIVIFRSCFSIFRSFKRIFLVGALLIVSIMLLLYARSSATYYASIIFYALLVLYTFISTIRSIFSDGFEVTLTKKLSPFLSKGLRARIAHNAQTTNGTQTPDSIDGSNVSNTNTNTKSELSSEDILGIAVLINRLLLATAKKLGEYKEKYYEYVFAILEMLLLFLFIVYQFALINTCLFFLDSSAFIVNPNSNPTCFHFFYYTFCSFFFQSISTISPMSVLARIFQMSMYVSSVITITIFIGSMISVKVNKKNKEMENVIQTITTEGNTLTTIVLESYNYSDLNQAISELQKSGSSLSQFIMYLSKFLGDIDIS